MIRAQNRPAAFLESQRFKEEDVFWKNYSSSGSTELT